MIKAKQGAAVILITLLTLSIITTFTAPVLAQEEDEDDEENPTDNQVQADEEEENEEPEITVAEEEEEGEEEEEFEEEEREVEVKEIDEDEIEIEAINPDEKDPEKDEDEHRLKISTEEGAKFELEYEDLLAAGENEEGREVEFEYEVEFDAIIEFVDNNGNGLYDEGEEIYEYDLEDTSFDPIQSTSENVSGVAVHTITMQTSNGVFKAVVYISGKPITVKEENVMPNEVKIDIEITNFPYQDNNSKLALKTELDSELEVEEEKREIEETDEEEVQVTSGNYGGFFSWKKTALVDGESRPVKSTNISDDPEEGDRELYLIYEHGDSIVHDPKIGVRGAIAGPIAGINWATVIAASMVAALVSVIVTSLMLKKKGYRSPL